MKSANIKSMFEHSMYIDWAGHRTEPSPERPLKACTILASLSSCPSADLQHIQLLLLRCLPVLLLLPSMCVLSRRHSRPGAGIPYWTVIDDDFATGIAKRQG